MYGFFIIPNDSWTQLRLSRWETYAALIKAKLFDVDTPLAPRYHINLTQTEEDAMTQPNAEDQD
jgi:hypothetical protein